VPFDTSKINDLIIVGEWMAQTSRGGIGGASPNNGLLFQEVGGQL